MSLVLDVRTLRRTSRLKQRELAEKVGITINQLTKIERGLEKLDEVSFIKLCTALGIDPSHSGSLQSLLTERACGEGYVSARPATATIVERRKRPNRGLKPIIDLFCGVGGFSFGFEMTGKFQVVAGVDILGDRLKTFVANHSTATAYGQDIRSLTKASLENDSPRPFAIVGGPPCQGFSSLRPFRNVEWNDPRNNLAEEFCRIVAELRPEWIVFENVV